MKKILVAILVLMTLLAATTALAEGVTVLNAPKPVETEQVSMDDIKVGKPITVDGYGVITLTKAEWADWIDTDWHNFNSGGEAEYYVLTVEILNMQYAAVTFQENCEIKADFGEGYVFGGWHRQYKSSISSEVGDEAGEKFAINPLYVGKYAFIVTLPNFVKDSTEPLSITVKLTDEVELTYHVRK